MGAFSYLGNIYNLDTLDTRFVVSSNTPYKAVVEARDDTATASKERAARWNSRPQSESRWKTPEFYLYYVLFGAALPSMFWVAYEASKSTT